MGGDSFRKSLCLVLVCFVANFVYADLPDQEPNTNDTPKTQPSRSPAFSPIELSVRPLKDGSFVVDHINPNGPFASRVAVGQRFDSLNEIPRP